MIPEYFPNHVLGFLIPPIKVRNNDIKERYKDIKERYKDIKERYNGRYKKIEIFNNKEKEGIIH
jgi:hypothetical protein